MPNCAISSYQCAVALARIDDLIERGLVFIIDGSKALARAIRRSRAACTTRAAKPTRRAISWSGWRRACTRELNDADKAEKLIRSLSKPYFCWRCPLTLARSSAA